MSAIGELQGQFVFTGLQKHQAFGLTLVEVLVLIVIWDDVAGLDVSGVDQYMEMTDTFAFVADRRNAHAIYLEFESKCGRYGIAIAWLDKVD